MTDACRRAQELLPELCLGILPGEERAGALAHIASCPACRRVALDLSVILDEMLELAPEHEPPAGFESRVIDSLSAQTQSPVRKRWTTLLAAALTAAVLAASATWWIGRDDRTVADRYHALLERAGGEYFAFYVLTDESGGSAGKVFAYEGDPSWLYVVMEEVPPGTYETTVEMASGDTESMRPIELAEGQAGWGTVLHRSVDEIDTFTLIESETGSTFVSSFDN